MLDSRDFDAIPYKFMGNLFIDTHYHQGLRDDKIKVKVENTIGSILYCLDKFTTIATVEPDEDLKAVCLDIINSGPFDIDIYESFGALFKATTTDIDEMGKAVVYVKNEHEFNAFLEAFNSEKVMLIINDVTTPIPENYKSIVNNDKLYVFKDTIEEEILK